MENCLLRYTYLRRVTYASDKSILTIDTKAMALAAITLLFLTCLVYVNIWLIHEESVTRGFADPDTHDLNRLFLSGSCHVRRADRAPRCRSLSRDLGRTPYSLHDRSGPGQGVAKAFEGITNQSIFSSHPIVTYLTSSLQARNRSFRTDSTRYYIVGTLEVTFPHLPRAYLSIRHHES